MPRLTSAVRTLSETASEWYNLDLWHTVDTSGGCDGLLKYVTNSRQHFSTAPLNNTLMLSIKTTLGRMIPGAFALASIGSVHQERPVWAGACGVPLTVPGHALYRVDEIIEGMASPLPHADADEFSEAALATDGPQTFSVHNGLSNANAARKDQGGS